MLYYKFSQNNSGGVFDLGGGLAHYVFIEATSANEANEIAQEIGIYFEGCYKERDCDCCGDRWYPAGEYDTLGNIEHIHDYMKNYAFMSKPKTQIRMVSGDDPFVFDNKINFSDRQIYAVYKAASKIPVYFEITKNNKDLY